MKAMLALQRILLLNFVFLVSTVFGSLAASSSVMPMNDDSTSTIAPTSTPNTQACIIQVLVYDKYHSPIKDATVRLIKDGREVGELSYVEWRTLYELSGSGLDYPLTISVKHPEYETQQRTIETRSSDVARHEFYLGKQGDAFYSLGQLAVPYEPRRDIIAVTWKGSSSRPREELVHLFTKLGLEEDTVFAAEARRNRSLYSSHRSIALLRKADGGEFDQSDCRELRELRQSKLVHIAGPLLGPRRFLHSWVSVQIEDRHSKQALQTAADLGLRVEHSSPSNKGSYILAVDDGLGLNLLEIIEKLREAPGVMYCTPYTSAFYTPGVHLRKGLIEVQVFNKDRKVITNATVRLQKDGQTIGTFFYCGRDWPRAFYMLSAAPKNPMTITVEHPDHEAQQRSVKVHRREGSTFHFYLGKQGDMYYPSNSDNRVMIPFEPQRDIIGVVLKRATPHEQLELLFDQLKLVEDSAYYSRYNRSFLRIRKDAEGTLVFLRKADGSEFDQVNSPELYALRKSDLISVAGIPLEMHNMPRLLQHEISTKITTISTKQVQQVAAAMGLKVTNYWSSLYTFTANEGCGLALFDIIEKLKNELGDINFEPILWTPPISDFPRGFELFR